MINIIIIFLFLFILINSIAPRFIYKEYLLNELSPIEISLNVWIIGGIISLLLIVFQNLITDNFTILKNKFPILKNKLPTFENNFIYNFNKNKKHLLLFIILSIFSFISTIIYYYLLDITNISKLTAYLSSISIILVALIAHTIYNRKISNKSFIGIIIIVIGLIIMSYFDNN